MLPPVEVLALGPLSGYVPLSLPRSDEDVEKIKVLFSEIGPAASGSLGDCCSVRSASRLKQRAQP